MTADVARAHLDALEPPVHAGRQGGLRPGQRSASRSPRADGADAEELLRNADVAMYMAKEKGKGRYQVFEPAMHDTALKRLELKADLQRALEHERVPAVLPAGDRARERQDLRGRGPDPLDPPASAAWCRRWTSSRSPRRPGLIVPIGRWVMHEAADTRSSSRTRYPMEPRFHMAVNLSARQIARPELVEEVREILLETGLEPSTLILEITESVMMQDMELSIERLAELKQLGVHARRSTTSAPATPPQLHPALPGRHPEGRQVVHGRRRAKAARPRP